MLYDVFRLLQIVDIDARIETQGLVKDSIDKFLDRIQSEDLSLDKIGISLDKESGINYLRNIYGE